MSYDDLPAGWQVWADEHEGRSVLAYRPDVFNTKDFPAPCMPTIYVTNGSRKRRPGASQVPTDTWHVSLFLEPEVEAPAERYDSRAEAVAGATDLAARFVRGGVDYRDLYQVPREEYLDRLDELVGENASDE
ncbi:hypothetical protein C2R22_11715 [Salinigranum rubrum]|uniref:Uncharacterized protein n=1 Tax=Salinigranum rubrum TaxID=755307 RepID=A0A2I8VPZ5_9EURY|nr:DUF5820 family protein [Salinigranum rubrum]AUV83966.1 hypothetical protein C2R22_11715 [Salinigranum rubrum]